MKIPGGALHPGDPVAQAAADMERETFYQDIITVCFASRQSRISVYETLMQYYTFGCSAEEGESAYNKIYPIIDTLTAFLYSADSTRFSASIGPEVPEEEWDKAPAASKAVSTEWQNSGADIAFGEALVLAEVYNTAIVKTVVKNGKNAPYVVEPHCFGVYREDINDLNRQEAMALSYYITRSQLENELEKHPQKDLILSKLQERTVNPIRDEMPAGLRRIIVTNAAGSSPLSPGNTVRGNGSIFMPERIDYEPTISVNLIEMVELWVWNDEACGGKGDYQTVTMADGRVTIYDRENIFVQGEHPFTHLCPNKKNGYFWGVSEVARLIGLQQWRNLRISEIKDLLAKQVNPPTSLEGWTGAIDEVDFALNKAGGVLSSSDPMAKINRYVPDITNDMWKDIVMIDEMFSEAAALPNLLMGRGEVGVRSGKQTSELSRLGSARIKKRALSVEHSLEALATKYLKAMRKYNKNKYMTEPTEPGVKPMPFLLNQMTPDVVIKVDAHTNSPLFVEDQEKFADEALLAKAIDRESWLELQNPPMKDLLIRRLKKIQADEAASAKAKMAFEKSLAAAKHAPAGPASA